MNNKSDRCISYIYNEMDPSEQMEFERELEQNQNLLIEVETLRKVSGRLQDIRLMDPPAELVEQIYDQASRAHASGTRSRNWWRWGSAAAILLISVSMSSYMLLPMADSEDQPAEENGILMGAPAAPQWSVEQEQVPEEGSSATESAVPQETREARIAPLINTPAPATMVSAPGDETGSPWIDHNNVLHFQDRLYSPNASKLDSIRNQSLKKLTPVEHSNERMEVRHRLHLTGSNRTP